jgi:hypothetical protein
MSMVRLRCGHTGQYNPPPRVEDLELYCRQCGEYREVVDDSDMEWRIKCAHCSLGRRFGTDEDAAYRTAARHAIKNPTHRVKITDGETEDYLGGTEPYIPEIQEWLAQNPTHQTSLRSLPKRDPPGVIP